jgi:hypothetical protein
MSRYPLSAVVMLLWLVPARAEAPPIELGLWEVQSTTTLQSAIPIQIPPEQAEQLKKMGVPLPGVPTTRTDQSCLDQHSLDRIGEGRSRSCHRQNVQLGPHGLSAEIVCDGDKAKGHGRIDLTFDDTTHFHGAIAIKGSSAAAPGINAVDVGLQGHWVGAQCGAVKPFGG